jgi:CMP/dCMP kinase
MKALVPFVITISRQIGSGGAYVGQQLAKKLNIVYADREIIRKAADQLFVLEADLTLRDEKVSSFWESFLQFNALAQDVYTPPRIIPPTDLELYRSEAEVIKQIADKQPAVIIGRCGSHILRDYPNHIRIFLHAAVPFRNERLHKLYNLNHEEADRMIAQSDKERALYCKKFTGKDWSDANEYDISIDTSKIGVDRTVELILDYLKLV